MIPRPIQFAYQYYNQKYWNNELPFCRVRFKKVLKDEKGRTLDGCHDTLWTTDKNGRRITPFTHEIWIRNSLRYTYSYALIVLHHEMTHVYLNIHNTRHDGHGYRFKDEIRRLQQMGAYNELLS